MHIGSSSRMPATSGDAPIAVAATLSFDNAMASMSDWLFSGKLVQFPDVKLAYSEGQIGWIPYILERADTVWEEHRAWGEVKDLVPEPPSTYYYRQMYGCFFRDQHGIDSLDKVGVDNITFETDYPHTDSTWPNTKAVATELMRGVDPVIGREDHARQRPPHALHGLSRFDTAARPRVEWARTSTKPSDRYRPTAPVGFAASTPRIARSNPSSAASTACSAAVRTARAMPRPRQARRVPTELIQASRGTARPVAAGRPRTA